MKSINNVKNILEIGGGNGELTKFIADKLDVEEIVCIDSNKELTEKSTKSNRDVRVMYEHINAFSYCPSYSFDLVISLHGCGSLTDRVIDIGVGSNIRNIICVPCCYSKINNEKLSLPRSHILKSKKEDYEKIINLVFKYEGSVKESDDGIRSIMRDGYRLLLNFDRLFYLQENGYDVQVTSICERKLTFSNHISLNNSMRFAIVGMK